MVPHVPQDDLSALPVAILKKFREPHAERGSLSLAVCLPVYVCVYVEKGDSVRIRRTDKQAGGRAYNETERKREREREQLQRDRQPNRRSPLHTGRV
mmetsp:Transcript_19510/g.39275  ORF Transcript_19510/g.39275 Transcript_19510/m.39275 type:complete len:97 (-) Transcript_19510:372-662(-)